MIDFDFSEKTVIVTGGSRGIGRAIAEGILRRGGRVLITSTGEAPSWCAQYRLCSHLGMDFLNEASVVASIDVIASMNRIDVLVNSAGIHAPQAVCEITESDWERVLRVNLHGPMRVMRAAAPRMKAARSGRIVNIASMSGVVSKRCSGAYSASKSGLIGLTRASALDLAPYNVLVNALCPGTTQTDMVETVLTEEQKSEFRAGIPLGRFATVNEIANFAMFLGSDLNTYITGQTIVVDGGVTAQ